MRNAIFFLVQSKVLRTGSDNPDKDDPYSLNGSKSGSDTEQEPNTGTSEHRTMAMNQLVRGDW